MVFCPEIYELLKTGGYDVTTKDDDEWDELQAQFEDECNDILVNTIENEKDAILLEWAHRAGIHKNKQVRSRSEEVE